MATAEAVPEEGPPTPEPTVLVDPAAPAPSRTAPAETPEEEPHRATPPTKQQVIAEFGSCKPREWGLQVTGTVGKSAARDIALTLDACGGPGGTGCDQQLLATLRKLNVPATLFLNERWIQANPELTAELARDPLFELANHGFLHRPLSVTGKSAYGIAGTTDIAQVYDEVMGNQAVLQDIIGHVPRFFRPGTAYYDEVAAAITRRLGVLPVNFTINGDGGATFAASTVAAEVGKARSGDIVIAHLNKPGSGTAPGLAQALPRLLGQGATFAKLRAVLP
jgi:peptidoglycan/xylan/chitin deacetylase (PgdA/CDA1 family)